MRPTLVSATLLDWSDTMAIWNEEPPRGGRRPRCSQLNCSARSEGSGWRDDLGSPTTFTRQGNRLAIDSVRLRRRPTDYLQLFDYAKAIGELLGEYAYPGSRASACVAQTLVCSWLDGYLEVAGGATVHRFGFQPAGAGRCTPS